MHAPHLLLLVALSACAQTVQPSNPPPSTPERTTVSSGTVGSCPPLLDEVVFPAWIAPSGTAEFREAIWKHQASLKCCGPDELDNVSLRVEFTEDVQRDEAWVSAIEASEPVPDPVKQCLQARVEYWVIRPAPRSDVVYERLRFSTRNRPEVPSVVRFALPAFR